MRRNAARLDKKGQQICGWSGRAAACIHWISILIQNGTLLLVMATTMMATLLHWGLSGPNEDLQFSVGSTVGNGEPRCECRMSESWCRMYLILDVAIGKEVLELKENCSGTNAQIRKLTALLNGLAGTNESRPQHYSLMCRITGHMRRLVYRRGLVEGYPDGTFGGDRMLTRYEFAQNCVPSYSKRRCCR